MIGLGLLDIKIPNGKRKTILVSKKKRGTGHINEKKETFQSQLLVYFKVCISYTMLPLVYIMCLFFHKLLFINFERNNIYIFLSNNSNIYFVNHINNYCSYFALFRAVFRSSTLFFISSEIDAILRKIKIDH